MWRAHPAFSASWNADVETYVTYDLESAADLEHPDAVRSVVSPEAVWQDGRELLRDETTRTAVDRVQAPVSLLRAGRGMLDDDRPLIPSDVVQKFAAAHPDWRVEELPDVNHYTILLGQGRGASKTAAELRAAIA
jgi:lipase